MQRPAEEGNTAFYRLAARKPRDRLVDHRLENGRRQICFCRPFVYKRLYIGFRKNTASCGYRINFLVISCCSVEPFRVGFQKGSHLVYEGARSSRADAVHSFIKAVFEINYFRVFAAEFDRDIGLRRVFFKCRRYRDDFLNKRYRQRFP